MGFSSFDVRNIHEQTAGRKFPTLLKSGNIMFLVMLSAKLYHAIKRVSIVAGGILDFNMHCQGIYARPNMHAFPGQPAATASRRRPCPSLMLTYT